MIARFGEIVEGNQKEIRMSPWESPKVMLIGGCAVVHVKPSMLERGIRQAEELKLPLCKPSRYGLRISARMMSKRTVCLWAVYELRHYVFEAFRDLEGSSWLCDIVRLE